MKTNNFFSIAIAAALLINCKGKDGAPGPAGTPSPVTEQSSLVKEGFIKGTLSTTVEGKPASYNFDFQGNDPGDRSYYTILDGRTEIVLYKSYIGDGDAFVKGELFMKFYVEDLTKMSTHELKTIYLYSTKQLASNELLDLEIDIDDVSADKPTNPLTFSELKYDPATNILTGKFSGGVNNRAVWTGTEYKKFLNTMSNGSFSTILFKKVSNRRKSN